jgi:hypothetical protein
LSPKHERLALFQPLEPASGLAMGWRIPAARTALPADPCFCGCYSFGVNGRTGRQLQNVLWERRIRMRA